MIRFATSLFLALSLMTPYSYAASGDPVAVSWWGQGMISIETMWNFRVVIDPFSLKIGYGDPHLSADLVLVTHEHHDHNNIELIAEKPHVARGLGQDGAVQKIFRVLDRKPNDETITWRDARERIARSLHAIVVSSLPAWHDAEQGKQRGATAMFLLEVDGVRIVHCGDIGQPTFTDEQLAAMSKVDLLLIPVGGKYTADGKQAAEMVRQVRPRFVVPIHYKTPVLKIGLETAESFVAALKDQCEVVRPTSNTLAISHSETRENSSTRLVMLDYQPWRMPTELFELFARKEIASGKSQEVFAPLTTEQMNHRPSNGTHTPRWNAEHMMGRELGFFSEIYAQLDPELSKIDLNPAQMPPDYQAAHPNWSGAEEARQMQRVTDFTRRFSYLLNGIELDNNAPGSRWTLRGLLEQMDQHYSEHTANVEKKFQLPDWPERSSLNSELEPADRAR